MTSTPELAPDVPSTLNNALRIVESENVSRSWLPSGRTWANPAGCCEPAESTWVSDGVPFASNATIHNAWATDCWDCGESVTRSLLRI